MEQREAFVDLEATDRELRRAAEPSERPHPKLNELALIARPRKVGVVGSSRLRVVVREERGVFIPPLAGPFEPARERGMESRASGLRQARICDFAREGVLDRVLAVARDLGAWSTPDEVAFLQDP